MGYEPRLLSNETILETGEIPYLAFGETSASLDGSHELLSFVLESPKLRKRFFTTNGSRVKQAAATDFLKKCVEFERLAVPLMHLLMGGTSRGTDFEQLTFRNGEARDLPRRLTFFEGRQILVERQARKVAFLKGQGEIVPGLIPRNWFEHVVHYWLIVRPFCSVLARCLKKSPSEVERWQRFCFINGSSKFITRSVETALSINGDGATFQRLRHACEAIFRRKVVPKEYHMHNCFNYDQLFGHKYQTGLSYGVQALIGSDQRHAGTDVSSVARCLTEWRKSVLDLDSCWKDALEMAEDVDTDDEDSDVDSVIDSSSHDGDSYAESSWDRIFDEADSSEANSYKEGEKDNNKDLPKEDETLVEQKEDRQLSQLCNDDTDVISRGTTSNVGTSIHQRYTYTIICYVPQT
jgi:hypothetical protein